MLVIAGVEMLSKALVFCIKLCSGFGLPLPINSKFLLKVNLENGVDNKLAMPYSSFMLLAVSIVNNASYFISVCLSFFPVMFPTYS